MGSVADLYTTGDDDPEIEPEQYQRHFLYCDACGSFKLDAWLAPDNHEEIERTRRWLWQAAVCDANPRKLAIAAMPRPLGSSRFLRGKSVPRRSRQEFRSAAFMMRPAGRTKEKSRIERLFLDNLMRSGGATRPPAAARRPPRWLAWPNAWSG